VEAGAVPQWMRDLKTRAEMVGRSARDYGTIE